jgi:hypothetical protein
MFEKSAPEKLTKLIKKTRPSTDSRINKEKTKSNKTDFIKETLIKLIDSKTIKDIISKIRIETRELTTNLKRNRVKVKNKTRTDKISIY